MVRLSDGLIRYEHSVALQVPVCCVLCVCMYVCWVGGWGGGQWHHLCVWFTEHGNVSTMYVLCRALSVMLVQLCCMIGSLQDLLTPAALKACIEVHTGIYRDISRCLKCVQGQA